MLQLERGLLSESLQIFRNITSCIRSWVFRHFFRCPFCNNCSPAISAFRSDINYIISGLDHVQIVFNYNNCISTIRKSSQNLHQFLNICKMQSGGRLIQNINSLTCTALTQLCSQLNTLCFSAGKSGGRLSKTNIGKPYII